MSLSSSLKSDFEQPVRDLPNKMVAWRQIHDQESSLDRTLKDQEKTITKLDKASAKKSAKADQLTADLNQINTTLTSLSPKVFATFQRLDEERLRSLKEVVVRWATSRADIATRDGERAEGSLTKLLSWETKDEVLAVANRLAGPHARSHTTSAQGGRSAPPAANATRKQTLARFIY
jgi:predicted RNase H-like nuclease (RuvC/YqgF family)